MEKPYYDDNTETVVINFSGMPELNGFKEHLYEGLELLKKHNSYKMLNDITHLEANSIENQEWTQKVWFPQVEKAGLKYFAFLVPENIHGQVSAEQTNEKAEEDGVIEINYFKDKEDPLKWLSSK